jgi:transposase
MLFFEDEARFGRINNLRHCWVPKDLVPIAARQMIREYIYVFSSVCPQTGELYSLILPACNTDAMQLFLNGLSSRYNHYRVILLIDKAGWHTSSKLFIPQNISLWHLPPYSPELNPVELIWRELRKRYFNNQLFDDLDALEDKLVESLKDFSKDAEAIKQLTNFSWLKL